MNSKKLFVFDIDGTFLSDEKKVLPSTLEAIKKLKEKKYCLAFATGRAPHQTFDILKTNGLEFDFVIGSNGGIIYDVKNKTYDSHGQAVPEKAFEAALKIAQLNKREFVFSDGIENWRTYFGVSPQDEIKDRDYFIGGSTATPFYLKWEDIKDIPKTKKIIHVSVKMEKSLTSKYYSILKNELGSIAEITTTSRVYIDVNEKNLSKFVGISKIQKMLDVSNENTYCFGDSFNDYVMLEKSGNGIAMGNADEEVKKIAKFVTDDNNSNGIANFLMKRSII